MARNKEIGRQEKEEAGKAEIPFEVVGSVLLLDQHKDEIGQGQRGIGGPTELPTACYLQGLTGRRQEDANQKELTVQLSDRIVLSPFVAKRLSVVLGNVIRDYELRYGKLDVENRQAADKTEA